MPLTLTYAADDESIKGMVSFFERRRYVVRTLVPAGYEPYFRDRARFSSAHTSTAIEGHGLESQQALHVLVHGPDDDQPDEIATANTALAYELIRQLAPDASLVIDQGLIRTLNSILLRGLPGLAAERRGKYRPGGALIVDATTRQVRYKPPPPEWVPELMQHVVGGLSTWIEEDPPPVAAAKAHFALISIHPFEDGNGRTARLLADLILEKSNWSVDGMLSINQYILGNRQDYYDVLRETQGDEFVDDVDVTPFVRFILEALTWSVARLEEQVVDFSRRKDAWVDRVGDALNPRQAIGLMYMIDMEPLSTATYTKLTGCSQVTALADLKQMLGFGVVVKQGAGKNTRYAIAEQVDTATQTETEIG